MLVSGYVPKVNAFFAHSLKLRNAIQSFAGTTPNSYIAGPSAGTAIAEKFSGGINLPTGEILFIPYSYNKVALYNPVTRVLTDGPSLISTGSARYRGGCYVPSTGIVVMAPLLSPYIGIYDTESGKFRNGPDLGASPGYHGAIVSSRTGKVILIPGTSPTIGIFDPSTETYTPGPAHGGTSTTYFSSAEELPDGRILLVPYSAGRFKIYDPVANTVVDGPTATSAAFYGSCKLPNGDVICCPYTSANAVIYRYSTNTVTNVTAIAGGAKFRGCAMAADGRVIFAPASYDKVGWYDPKTHAYGEGVQLNQGGGVKHVGAVAASNGEIILVPYANEFVGRFLATSSGALPIEAMRSINYNKA